MLLTKTLMVLSMLVCGKSTTETGVLGMCIPRTTHTHRHPLTPSLLNLYKFLHVSLITTLALTTALVAMLLVTPRQTCNALLMYGDGEETPLDSGLLAVDVVVVRFLH